MRVCFVREVSCANRNRLWNAATAVAVLLALLALAVQVSTAADAPPAAANATAADLEKRLVDLTASVKSAAPAERGAAVERLIATHVELAQVYLDAKKYQPALQLLRKAKGVANQHPDGRRAQDLAGEADVRVTLADWRERNDGLSSTLGS